MIETELQLSEMVTQIQEEIPETSLLLFRGQTNKYDKIRSGRARPDAFIIPEVEDGWNTIVNRISSLPENNKKYNQAILQHYGFPTYYLDLTSNPLTAAWFACNKFSPLKPVLFIGNSFRFHDETTYEIVDEGIGYIYVLEIPNYKTLIVENKLFDITKESKFLRPKNQDAYLLLDHPPRIPNPNSLIKQILTIDRNKFESTLTIKQLFPHPNSDEGYSALLNVPFVQLPSFYINDNTEEKEGNNKEENNYSLDFDKYFVLGKRAIKIPFYISDQGDLHKFKPKWKDTTIFEPSPFRLWKTEKFNLKDIHEGQDSVLGETTKITISPLAFYKILTHKEELKLEWPNVKSNSLFFTKAVLDHDKVIDHQPPYVGIWLHKDNDLIIETHLISDKNDELLIELGHAFTLSNNKLQYVKVENECNCGKPEEHKDIIESILKIHALIKKEEIALIQHPFFIEKWYVLI